MHLKHIISALFKIEIHACRALIMQFYCIATELPTKSCIETVQTQYLFLLLTSVMFHDLHSVPPYIRAWQVGVIYPCEVELLLGMEHMIHIVLKVGLV